MHAATQNIIVPRHKIKCKIDTQEIGHGIDRNDQHMQYPGCDSITVPRAKVVEIPKKQRHYPYQRSGEHGWKR